MATNLRLSKQAAAAVKAEAERTGRSQQDVIRTAVDAYLAPPSATTPPEREPSWRDQLIPPKTPFRTIPESEMIIMPEGMTSLDLLDREDRV
ncbi:MAG: ribbon-helix-helix protein, CopG family [Thermoleophilaceae bacterium]|nr:ribbon-helix-helix protein, CopG family [Thermoleophilaceae bacterium]